MCIHGSVLGGWVLYLYPEVITLRPRQNGRHFAGDIFKWIFLNENRWISIIISLELVPKDPINNVLSLVQIMVWRRSEDKSSEPMNAMFIDAYMCHSASIGYIDGSVQDCGISSASALEIPQCCTKLSMYRSVLLNSSISHPLLTAQPMK